MLAPEQARIALFRISTLGRCQEETAKNDGGATECCMLGSHLNDLSSYLGNGHLSLASKKVDKDCVILDARVGMCGWFFCYFLFSSKTRKNVGTSMCSGWRRDVSRILTSRSREGQAKLGGNGGLRWRVGVVRPVRCRAGTCHPITHGLTISCPPKGEPAVTSLTKFIGFRFRCR